LHSLFVTKRGAVRSLQSVKDTLKRELLAAIYMSVVASSLLNWTHKSGDDFAWMKPGPEFVSLTRLAASDIAEFIGEHLSVAEVNSRIALLAHVFSIFFPDALIKKTRIGCSGSEGSSPTAATQNEIDISEYTNSLDALGDESTMTMSQLTGEEHGENERPVTKRSLAQKPQNTGTSASAGLYIYNLYIFCVYN
jgi:hypothetical protein